MSAKCTKILHWFKLQATLIYHILDFDEVCILGYNEVCILTFDEICILNFDKVCMLDFDKVCIQPYIAFVKVCCMLD